MELNKMKEQEDINRKEIEEEIKLLLMEEREGQVNKSTNSSQLLEQFVLLTSHLRALTREK
jgi:hypothetical protein